ncbi:cysteine synthase family protein [Amycolatopsis sp. NPDC059021]|uniref:cysteine synthase family protein n=1 Tax=Amycolatopsis sp. NPDC059021 TaxID=3346704 RepID=UPI00366DB9B8
MSTATLADVVDTYRVPRVVRLGPNLFGAAFFLMKLIPARHILRQAREAGVLGPGTAVIETTSGTFGLALAMECALTGNPLTLVGDPVIDVRLHRRLTDLGARVEIVTSAGEPGGVQGARLARLAEIRASTPDHFCPEQYGNPGNPASYHLVAEVLADQLGRVDCLVGPVGSGGSMCGTARHLRSAFPGLRAVAVDTHGSVLFGQPDGERQLRGLGNSLLPANVDHAVFDEVHWIGAGQAYAATRELHRGHALFMGPTSGAAVSVARWWAAEHPDATTVVMLPDEGHRYIDTVYDDDWLRAGGLAGLPVPDGPRWLSSVTTTTSGWAALRWDRRSLVEHRQSGRVSA